MSQIELFPAFAGAEDGGWQKLISGGAGGGGKGSSSALLGDYAPVAQQPAAPAAAAPAGSNATPPQTSAAPQCAPTPPFDGPPDCFLRQSLLTDCLHRVQVPKSTGPVTFKEDEIAFRN